VKKIQSILVLAILAGVCYSATGPAGFNWTISWRKNKEIDMRWYKIYVNGVPLTIDHPDTSVKFLSITKNTSFFVTAVDSSQNESGNSDTVFVYIMKDTTEVPPIIPPIPPPIVVVKDTIAPSTPSIIKEPKIDPLVWGAKDFISFGKASSSANLIEISSGTTCIIPYTIPNKGVWLYTINIGAKLGLPVLTFDDSTKTNIIFQTNSGYLYTKEVCFLKDDPVKFTVSGGTIYLFGDSAIKFNFLRRKK